MLRFPSKSVWIWAFAALVTLAGLGLLSRALLGPRERTLRSPGLQIVALGEWETDPALWGRNHPRQYQSWLRSQEPSKAEIGFGPGRTKWGGQRQEPRTPEGNLLIEGSSRSRDPKGGFLRHPAVCLDCHDPRTLALRISRRPFQEAMARRGIDVAMASRQEMRTYVCAQCHVASIPAGPGGSPRMPWDRGWNGDEIAAACSEAPELRDHADFTHAVSGAPMLWMRHPEFELWKQGSHGSRGVSCADCHMPLQVEGTARYSRHELDSPLLAGEEMACGRCHRARRQELRAQVELIQDRTAALEARAVKALLSAHRALGACLKAGVEESRLSPLRQRLREAQIRWDLIASEGSTGFHGPQESARLLGVTLDLARSVERDALELRLNSNPSSGDGKP
jgi:nitrite reductase (cytochrome c-552)